MIGAPSIRLVVTPHRMLTLPTLSVLYTRAGFGWLHDPLLEEVQVMLNAVTNKSANHTVIPWTTAVPGAATNWTSVEDTRRRRNPDVYKTGKKNPNQVSGDSVLSVLGRR
jgi:hypothetical protein